MQPSIWWLTLNKWPCSMCCNCQCARRPVLWARTLYKSWVARSWWGHTSCVSDASPGHRRRYNLSTQTTSSPQVWCLSLDSHFAFLQLTVLFRGGGQEVRTTARQPSNEFRPSTASQPLKRAPHLTKLRWGSRWKEQKSVMSSLMRGSVISPSSKPMFFTKKQFFSGQTCMSQGSMLQSKDASRSPSHFLPRGPWNSNIEWNFWQVHWKN